MAGAKPAGLCPDDGAGEAVNGIVGTLVPDTPERHLGMILNIALNMFTAAQAAIKEM